MQPSEIISVNIWQIVVSLLNLLIIFLIIKKFLFKPIKKAMDSRQEKIDTQYSEAENALESANKTKLELEARLSDAEDKSEEIIQTATTRAQRRTEKIVAQANKEAEEIVSRAKTEAELEKKKAESEIKTQIIDVSSALTEKLIEREVKVEDHHRLIDSFIDEMDSE